MDLKLFRLLICNQMTNFFGEFNLKSLWVILTINIAQVTCFFLTLFFNFKPLDGKLNKRKVKMFKGCGAQVLNALLHAYYQARL